MAFDLRTLLLAQQAGAQEPMSSEMSEEQKALLKRRQMAIDSGEAPPQILSGPPPMPMSGNAALQRMIMTNPMEDPAARAARADAEMQIKKLMAAQEQSIARQEAAAQEIRNQKPGLDLSGFAALADQWTGGNLSATARANAPMRPEERAALLAKLEQGASGDRQGMINVLGSKMAARDAGKMQMELMKELNKGGRFSAAQAKDLKKFAFTQMEQTTKDLGDTAQGLGKIETALASGDYQSVMSTLGNYARTISGEKGVLTDPDIARVMPRTVQQDLAKLAGYASGEFTEKLSPEVLKQMANSVAAAKMKYKEVKNIQLMQKQQGLREMLDDPGYQGYIDELAQGKTKEMESIFGAGGAPAGGPVMSPQDWLKNKRGG